jgi:hypothetical protein
MIILRKDYKFAIQIYQKPFINDCRSKEKTYLKWIICTGYITVNQKSKNG